MRNVNLDLKKKYHDGFNFKTSLYLAIPTSKVQFYHILEGRVQWNQNFIKAIVKWISLSSSGRWGKKLTVGPSVVFSNVANWRSRMSG